MENIVTYCFLDHLPKVPSDLLEEFTQYKASAPILKIPPADMTKPNGREVHLATYERYPITGKLREWLEFNIVRGATDYGASFNNAEENANAVHDVHLDYTRHYSLIYVITRGGGSATTRFWQEEGQGLERLDINVHVPPRELNSYLFGKDLKVIDSVEIPEGRWCLLNAKIIHDVCNLSGVRSSIQISLPKDNKFVN